MYVQQFSLAVHQRQEGYGDVIVSVEVGACAEIVVAVILHGDQGREVSACVTQGDGTLPTEALLPQQGQVHTCTGRETGQCQTGTHLYR